MTSTSLATTDTPDTQEFRARQALGLDQGPDIEDLVPEPDAREKKSYKAFERASPELALSMPLQMYVAKITDTRIVDTVTTFMSGPSTLIKHLGTDILSNASVEQLRATPSVWLQKILDSTQATALTEQLLKQLKWYGANPGEQTPASIRYQLLCKAIRLYVRAPSVDHPDALEGFSWQDPTHWGKSYQTLRSAFEQHLLKSRRAADSKEAIVLAHVLYVHEAKDFTVGDIPSDLRYRSSMVWVNFMHGVLLADELGLDRLQPLSFQQLVNLPLERSTNASTEELEKITCLRLSPTLDWAVCMGIVQPRETSDYTEEEVERAIAALERQSESLNKAVQSLELRPPDRLQMAKRMKEDALGTHVLGTDGRKLLRDDPPAALGHRNMPSLKLEGYGFLDLYADGQFDDGKRWFFTEPDGKTRTIEAFRMDKNRYFYSEREVDGIYRQMFSGGIVRNLSGKPLPDVNAEFASAFDKHLTTIRSAYKTLILSLLVSLPQADRRMLEQGDIEVLGLRAKTRPGIHTEPLARKGFVLKVQLEGEFSYYEVIPSAGFIRQRTGLRFSTINGVFTEFPLHAVIPGQTFSSKHSTSLLLDWDAHANGATPAARNYYIGFIDVVARVSRDSAAEDAAGTGLESSRLIALADHIATHFLYVDEKHLRIQARGMTTFDITRAKIEKRLAVLETIVKSFVPFWGSIDDLSSEGTGNKVMGALGLLLDLASFLFPVGKFISGSVRLARAGASVTGMVVKASLPSFSTLSRKLITSSLKNLNPLDGIPTLAKSLALGSGKGLLAAGRLGLGGIRRLAGQVDNYRLIHNMPQAMDPGRWKPLTHGDQMASINGVDDILIRNTSPTDLSRFHLVDPATSLPYGPRLSNNPGNLIHGQSTFKTLPPSESHVLVEIPESAHIREVLEVDGRTTLLIDDIPYRLDGNQLRRADLIDETSMFKSIPCRVRRAPDSDVCKTSYVTRTPAPTPAPNSQDTSKGWAPWFGDTIYTPAISSQPLLTSAIKTYKQLNASLEFQKGIYARIKVRLPYDRSKKFDTLEVGAIIAPAKDDSKHFVFTRLNAGDFYVAERLPGQALADPLVLRKAQTLPVELAEELKTVYTGSLCANNTARIHTAPAVERALKTMEEIAIPLGTNANPPAGMKWLKVDTSSGEALMFDHQTRMIVAKLAEGATTWTRSKDAPEALRQRTADIFDTLFLSPTINPPATNASLRIDATMQKLQKLLSRFDRTDNARNIAYAEVITANGVREVYVSVSGAHGTTKHLPLFRHLGANHVKIGDTTYINVDFNLVVGKTNLELTDKGRLAAVPLTIKNIDTYTPTLAARPTSLDSESKLIRVIREKYTDPLELKSVDVATTMPPCESCSLVMKEFGHRGEADALQVLWK
ncbi:hypothetical protein DLD99_20485 [Pseudomonas kribbensis]|uniref:Deaminase n=1 Tax=Pseudomonas kribbensis TaxID=1628086 RepID=A0A345RTY9_9PSED|nr:hypothetical protein [Pseudomonas kribbensis]AXI62755.1 hypothetical protein DLD99_20485 [Pseudomonas kribbensis]